MTPSPGRDTPTKAFRALIGAACAYYESADNGSSYLEQADRYKDIWKRARAYGRVCRRAGVAQAARKRRREG